MKAITPILDSMAVLAAIKGHTEDGAEYLADQEWLDDSIFPSIVQHKDLIARLTEGPSNNYCFGLNDFDDIDDFFLDGDSSDRKPCSFDTADHMLANIWFLIDMATDALAKEIKNIPAVNQLGQSYEKTARRNLLNNEIEERVRLFILDELPKTLVEYLAQNVEHVVDIFQLELQTFYQVMFLLTDHKAGVGGDSFMIHYNYDERDPDGPFLDFEDYTYDCHIDFFFPLADMLCPDRCWLNDDNEIDMEEAKNSDLYFVKKCYEVCTKNSTDVVLSGEWRYLSIGGKGINKARINQSVLNMAVLSLYNVGDLASVTLAKNIVNKGAVSDSWKGVYYPPIKFED